jgi:ferrochelatase
MSTSPAQPGVLLLAYGSPDTVADVECYLHDVRGGRPPTPELVADLRARYAAIGGRSPLLDLTRAQAAAVRDELARRGQPQPVAVGMRHWDPRLKAGLAELRTAGVTDVTALILAPHRCHATLAAYRKALEAALAELDWPVPVRWIAGWSAQPQLIAAQAELLRQALATVPVGRRANVLFSAHSLPARILAGGDPYPADLLANATAVATAIGGLDWQFVYQSAGASGGEWLGPPIDSVIPDLARAGCQALVVQPIGFVCDHLEVLYDLDIAARDAARARGIAFARTAMVNDDARVLRALAARVRSFTA